MRRSIGTMVGFGLMGAVFLAILSVFYLKQIPGKEQLAVLTDDLQQEFGPYLDPSQPIEAKLVPPARKGDPMSLRVRCMLRDGTVLRDQSGQKRVLRMMGERTLRHPKWVAKVGSVEVRHVGKPELSVMVRPDDREEPRFLQGLSPGRRTPEKRGPEAPAKTPAKAPAKTPAKTPDDAKSPAAPSGKG